MSITDCQYRLGQCRAIGHAAQGYRRELQTRDPASFGPMLEHLQQLLIDRFVRAIGQQAPGLLRRKAEVHCPNLIHIAAATHARVGQGRIRPGADHQMQAWWRILQQCRQELVHLSFGDLMVVVEDKNEVLRQIQELIAERGAERLRGMLDGSESPARLRRRPDRPPAPPRPTALRNDQDRCCSNEACTRQTRPLCGRASPREGSSCQNRPVR